MSEIRCVLFILAKPILATESNTLIIISAKIVILIIISNIVNPRWDVLIFGNFIYYFFRKRKINGANKKRPSFMLVGNFWKSFGHQKSRKCVRVCTSWAVHDLRVSFQVRILNNWKSHRIHPITYHCKNWESMTMLLFRKSRIFTWKKRAYEYKYGRKIFFISSLWIICGIPKIGN